MEWHDHTTAAVLNPTEIKTWSLNIDSRFRDYSQSTSSTDFYIRLPRVYKNVISIKLSSIEIPNTWFSFSQARGDTSFKINNSVISISEGNYAPVDLAAAINTSITAAIPTPPRPTLVYPTAPNPPVPLMVLSNATNFTLEFGTAQSCGTGTPVTSGYLPYFGGIGYMLGFTSQFYSNSNQYTAEYIVDTGRDNYVFLQLPELDMTMDSITLGNTSIRSFAKITVNVPKNQLIYVNGGDTVTRTIEFAQPTNVPGFKVKLVDAYGLPVDLKADFSFTLEVQEVVSSKVYDAYRTNLVS